jgi:hypothetical protein
METRTGHRITIHVVVDVEDPGEAMRAANIIADKVGWERGVVEALTDTIIPVTLELDGDFAIGIIE